MLDIALIFLLMYLIFPDVPKRDIVDKNKYIFHPSEGIKALVFKSKAMLLLILTKNSFAKQIIPQEGAHLFLWDCIRPSPIDSFGCGYG